MPPAVVMGATLTCTFGMAPSNLIVLPQNRVMMENKPAANIMDNKPIANVPPFGMCQSLANPTVASATATALGVLTPMPCVPVIVAPWVPGAATVLIANMPAVDATCTLTCNWGGIISITNPGTTKEQIP